MNELGNVYGELTVIEQAPKRDTYRCLIWVCKCSCGRTKEVGGTSLRNGTTWHCGCKLKRRTDEEQVLRKNIDSYKTNAKKRGYSFELTNEEFKEIATSDCYYCGAKPKERTRYRVTKRKDGSTNVINFKPTKLNGIDRVDNALGYSKDNCVASCSICNWMKSNMSTLEFFAHIEKISHRHL